MLKGIDPLVSAELLFVLAAMGHGDSIVIADANFPAASVACHTVHGRAIPLACDAMRALRAVLSLMPLDPYDDDPVLTMQVVGDADAVPEVVAEAAPLIAAEGFTATGIERHAFYARARDAFAVILSAESRPYGNFILRKGVIGFD
ncbi:MAG: RbsD/FucU domain-containing protein [Paracoccus sp. (in: a-proteobacteria)]|nr:RbsD/FucU domain-containing protein [Paracoccus sp. (in: a-proteobacteria)]